MKTNASPSDPEIEKRLDLLREVPGRDPAAAAAGRAHFLEQAQALSRQPRRVPAGATRPVQRTGLRRLPALNFLLAACLALVVVFGAGAATVYAAQDSLPGDALYPVKTFSEDVRLTLAASPEQQLDLTLAFTDRRAAEIRLLLAAGRPVPQNAVDRYRSELDRLLELSADMQEPGMARSLISVSSRAEGQLKALDALQGASPADQALEQIQSRLQEQVDEAQAGQSDPQGFRQKVDDQFKSGGHGEAENPTSISSPQGTPLPPGSTPPGPHNPQNDKPTKTPGDHGPGEKTRQPGGSSGNKP